MDRPYILPAPNDPSPDQGPKDYPVWLALAVSPVLVFLGVRLMLPYMEQRGDTEALKIAGEIALTFTCMILWLWWRVWLMYRAYRRLPEIEDILRGRLDFEPGIFAGVHIAAFFHPIEATPGGHTTLLIFLQNTNTRWRGVRITLAASPELGIAKPTFFLLGISAGEATVLRVPLRLNPETSRDRIPLTLTCKWEGWLGYGGQFRFARGLKKIDFNIESFLGGIKHSHFEVNPAVSRVTSLEPILGVAPRRMPTADLPQPAAELLNQYRSIYAPHRGEMNAKLVGELASTPGHLMLPPLPANAQPTAQPNTPQHTVQSHHLPRVRRFMLAAAIVQLLATWVIISRHVINNADGAIPNATLLIDALLCGYSAVLFVLWFASRTAPFKAALCAFLLSLSYIGLDYLHDSDASYLALGQGLIIAALLARSLAAGNAIHESR